MKEFDLTPEQMEEFEALARTAEELQEHAKGLVEGFDAKQKAERDAFIDQIVEAPKKATEAVLAKVVEISGLPADSISSSSLNLKSKKLRVAEESDPCECPRCRMAKAFGGVFEELAKASHCN